MLISHAYTVSHAETPVFSPLQNNSLFKVVSEVEMKMWLAFLLTYRSLSLYHPLSLPDKLVLFTICYPKCIKCYLSC